MQAFAVAAPSSAAVARGVSLAPSSGVCASSRPTARRLQEQRREFTGSKSDVRSVFLPSSLRQPAVGGSELAVTSASVNNPPPSFSGVSRFQDNENVQIHSVTIRDPRTGESNTVQVPSNQYILRVAEGQDVFPPYACRNGCCTTCAVRVKKGDLIQPEAMGLSRELRQQGYALLCVSYPRSDLEVELQDEDEVYMLQFGQFFAKGKVESSGILIDDD